ncbi:MAG TPA: 4-alpha-glucanotransferase [Gammaproteobacteria bacterium]
MNNTEIDEGLLVRLCELLGIDGEFYDYKGRHHVIGPAVRRRLVEALGNTRIEGNHQAEALIHNLETEGWRLLLPPTLVIRGESVRSVDINVPEELIGRPADWRLHYEDGGILEKTFLPQEQEYIAERIVDGHRILRYRLHFPFSLVHGYHQLAVTLENSGPASCNLIVAPLACYQPQVLDEGRRLWGLSVQLYTLRSARNWGIGDFTDLEELVTLAGKQGAAFVGLNPLHALFPANPHHVSPYSPSSRLFLNYIYLDITAVQDYYEHDEPQALVNSDEFQSRLATQRGSELVDYPAVAALKLEVLRLLYKGFIAKHMGASTPRAKSFQAFLDEQGEDLVEQAAYDAIYGRFFAQDWQAGTWRRWPDSYKHPDRDQVRIFIRNNGEEIRFYQYLQWLSDQQLAAVQRTAIEAGMPIGLYRDLAVGVDGGGAEAWAEQNSYSFEATVGAPPDPLALHGQDWGLPPLNPHRLRENGYSTFVKVIRSNMRHCGALRIDHVMGLFRLWWVPKGDKATNGAYVYYPLHDLLGVLALESQRNRCLVIGEDLGTVPDEIRVALPEANVYSYKVAYFEKDDNNRFKPPRDYVHRAMATVTTHDLPTLAGWWEGIDLEMRDELKLFPTDEIRDSEYASRDYDRQVMLEALQQAGNLPEGMGTDPSAAPGISHELSTAVHVQLAASNAALMVVQPEDLILMRKPVNVPGTTDQYPNWRRKLSQTTAEIFEQAQVRDMLSGIVRARYS